MVIFMILIIYILTKYFPCSTIVLTVHPSSESKSSDDKHFHEGPNNVFTTNNISTNNNVTSRVNNGTMRFTKRHGSVESDITQTR